tara:strand:- start:237 stop:461 length:225 start_codon:yes stop_codon:yes gene_type:complete
MNNINALKEIISIFLKVNPDKIDDKTIIDTTAIEGSVLFHRMISRVNRLYSIEIEDYSEIHTFEDLKNIIEKEI